MDGVTVRTATDADAAAIAAIYAPVVRDTHVSFEVDPPTAEEVAARMARAVLPWLVWDDEGVAGFAHAGPFRDRAAYRWTAESSVYVAPARRRRGIGTALAQALLDRLQEAGYRSVMGVVALPNPASEGLLETFGFRRVGVVEEAGFKLDRWWDVALWQRRL